MEGRGPCRSARFSLSPHDTVPFLYLLFCCWRYDLFSWTGSRAPSSRFPERPAWQQRLALETCGRGLFEAWIHDQRRADAVARFLPRRVQQPDDDDGRIAPAAIDLHLEGEGFDAIDSGGQNTGQHGCMLGERGRKGNAVFAPLWDKRYGR